MEHLFSLGCGLLRYAVTDLRRRRQDASTVADLCEATQAATAAAAANACK